MSLSTRQRDLAASAAVLFSGAGWGLFWLPARFFDRSGLDGAWLSLWLFVISLAVVVPFACYHWRAMWESRNGILITGLFTGSAFALYTVSLVITDVIHALLLFYISPAWATLINWVLRGEPITVRRLSALALGFSGLATVLGAGGDFPLPRNFGDWLALTAGVLWAYGSTRSNAEKHHVVTGPVVGFTAGGFLAALILVSLPIEGIAQAPTAAALADTLPWVSLLTVALFVPTTYALLWSTQVLDPGRVGILLMSEVVVGSVSAALLSGEPFGWCEGIGAALIVVAGVVEVTGQRPAASHIRVV
jgi:drug/metabolite transporter (DMT)-like permease